jgi:hypothetical protein
MRESMADVFGSELGILNIEAFAGFCFRVIKGPLNGFIAKQLRIDFWMGFIVGLFCPVSGFSFWFSSKTPLAEKLGIYEISDPQRRKF